MPVSSKTDTKPRDSKTLRALNILRVGDAVFHCQSGVWATPGNFKFGEITAAFKNTGVPFRLRAFGRVIQPVPGTAQPTNESELSLAGVPVARRGMWPLVRRFPTAIRLLRLHMRAADIVWVTLPSMLGLLAIEMNARRKPCVTQMVGDPEKAIAALSDSAWTKLLSISAGHLVRRALTRVDGAVFVSEALRNAYLKDSRQRSLIANENRVRREQLIDMAELRVNHDSADPQSPTLVYVGRLAPEKGLHLLLQALVANKRVQLTLVGNGPEQPHLEQLVTQLQLGSRVHFVGSLPWGDNLLKFLRRHQGLVLPSFTEGLPLVLLEAMSQGVPVIASAVGGIPELIRHGRNGLLVPAGDVAGLAKAIAQVTSDPTLRYRLACEGLRSAKSSTCELQYGKLAGFILDTLHLRQG